MKPPSYWSGLSWSEQGVALKCREASSPTSTWWSHGG
jgi:hypothetical protein